MWHISMLLEIAYFFVRKYLRVVKVRMFHNDRFLTWLHSSNNALNLSNISYSINMFRLLIRVNHKSLYVEMRNWVVESVQYVVCVLLYSPRADHYFWVCAATPAQSRAALFRLPRYSVDCRKRRPLEWDSTASAAVPFSHIWPSTCWWSTVLLYQEEET